MKKQIVGPIKLTWNRTLWYRGDVSQSMILGYKKDGNKKPDKNRWTTARLPPELQTEGEWHFRLRFFCNTFDCNENWFVFHPKNPHFVFLRCGNVCSHKSDAGVHPCDTSHPVRDQPSSSWQVRSRSASKTCWIFNFYLIFCLWNKNESHVHNFGLSCIFRPFKSC